jgi:hypothetical protein
MQCPFTSVHTQTPKWLSCIAVLACRLCRRLCATDCGSVGLV